MSVSDTRLQRNLSQKERRRQFAFNPAEQLVIPTQINTTLPTAIAQQWRTEEDLRESEERYRTIFENANDAIAFIALNGTITSVNRSAERLTGLPREQIIGHPFIQFLTPSSITLGEERLQRALAGKQLSSTFEIELLRSNGRAVAVEARTRLLRDHNGTLTGFLGIYRDITERKRAGATLEQLRQQNELILNSAGEGIFGVDEQGRITFVNPAAARLLGYEVLELLGQPLHERIHHHKADGAPYPAEACPMLHTLHDGRSVRITDEVYWHKDGTSFPVEYVSTPMHNVHNNVIGAVVTFQDITHRKAVEQVKNEILSTVSHELRTPLASLRGFTELMLKREFSPEKQRELLTVIHSESIRLSRLIDDFLDLYRIEEGHLPYAFAPVMLEPLLHEIAGVFTIERGTHSLCLENAPYLPAVRADAARIQQVLANLLSNAIKFSPGGGEVILGARLESRKMLIWVKDQGLGIPPEAIPKLFTKFFRVDNTDTRDIGGTGLGLALVKELITAHQGQVWVESTLGGGSTFFFTLPLWSE